MTFNFKRHIKLSIALEVLVMDQGHSVQRQYDKLDAIIVKDRGGMSIAVIDIEGSDNDRWVKRDALEQTAKYTPFGW